MTSYLVTYGTDPTDRLAAYAFTDRPSAIHAATTCVVPRVPADGTGGGCAVVIETSADVVWSKTVMATICRGLANFGPTHFSDRNAGIKRLMEVLAQYAQKVEVPQGNPVPTMSDRASHEAWMCANATQFVASVFRGLPKIYDRKEAKTLDEIRKLAVSLYEDRPVMIYAVCGSRQIHLENYDPKEVFVSKESKVKRERKPKSEKMTRKMQELGPFVPVREGSSLHRIVESALRGGRTYAEIAQEAGIREDQASHRIRYVLGVRHGIGHSKDESGVVTLHLPSGKSANDLVKSKEPQQQAAE